MPHTHPTRTRREAQARQHTRLRHRLLQAERLEDRQLLATISGTVFNDLNADGVKNTGESGQSGWTVYLDADGNGQLGTGEISAITAADGSYSFGGLAAGTYTVAEVLQPGWQQTSPSGTAPTSNARVSPTDGTQGNGTSYFSSISADGRYVNFLSDASNFVAGDTNGMRDVFVYDRETHTIERVSLYGSNTPNRPSLSADGRYVAFSSSASNLVSGDTNGEVHDVFVYDRQTDKVQLVSVAADGTLGSNFSSYPHSADGRYVGFYSESGLVSDDTNGCNDIFVTANPFAWAPGSHVVTVSASQSVSGIDFGNTSSTKFYVVNDATQNLTYEYNSRVVWSSLTV